MQHRFESDPGAESPEGFAENRGGAYLSLAGILIAPPYPSNPEEEGRKDIRLGER